MCSADLRSPSGAPTESPSPVEQLCHDKVKNGRETAVDCGGGECPPCGVGRLCRDAYDCESLVCDAEAGKFRCAPAAASAAKGRHQAPSGTKVPPPESSTVEEEASTDTSKTTLGVSLGVGGVVVIAAACLVGRAAKRRSQKRRQE